MPGSLLKKSKYQKMFLPMTIKLQGRKLRESFHDNIPPPPHAGELIGISLRLLLQLFLKMMKKESFKLSLNVPF